MEHSNDSYSKDMSHTTWERTYDNQRKRAELLDTWLDALQLQPGDRMLDVGCGPGFTSLVAARRVGPQGKVFAIDVSADALAFLEKKQQQEGIHNIERIQGNAETLAPLPEPAQAALVTMMLHHADHPELLLKNIVSFLQPGARALVAEFHPDGPGKMGPPKEVRIAPETALSWCTNAGFRLLEERQQSPEHYMLLLERSTTG